MLVNDQQFAQSCKRQGFLNPRLIMRRDFFNRRSLNGGLLRAVGVYCRCVPHNVTKLSDAGSARTAHSRAPDLRCFAVHSYTTAFAVLGPDSGNAVSPFIPASARTSSEQSLQRCAGQNGKNSKAKKIRENDKQRVLCE